MKISFHGACREVTGSCTLIELKNTKFLVDCGMFQGEHFASSRNFDDFDFDPSEIDFVLLTHAHIDHCGRIPKLYKNGFRGKIYCTEATNDLVSLMLADSAKIISSDAKFHNMEPFYGQEDVDKVLKLFKNISYEENLKINNEVSIKARNSSHILGACFFEVLVKDANKEKKLVFSGDIGTSPSRIIKDLEFSDGADLVFIESTYAGETHESRDEGLEIIKNSIIDCVKNKGTLIIPVFALEKSQEILYELNHLIENGIIPPIPMFLDSPLAIKATNIYKKHKNLYNEKSRNILLTDDDLFKFPGMEFTKNVQESKEINNLKPPKVILAGGGMCVGGRIQHHLKFNLHYENNHVLLVAYQVKGSLGRKLMKGHNSVKIHDSDIPVRAKISVINSYSAHGDQKTLFNWIKKMKKPKPKNIFVIHGEERSSLKFKDEISKEIDSNITVPKYGEVYDF
jgi:metallo-beta-lactamase family protein